MSSASSCFFCGPLSLVWCPSAGPQVTKLALLSAGQGPLCLLGSLLTSCENASLGHRPWDSEGWALTRTPPPGVTIAVRELEAEAAPTEWTVPSLCVPDRSSSEGSRLSGPPPRVPSLSEEECCYHVILVITRKDSFQAGSLPHHFKLQLKLTMRQSVIISMGY